jgi:hypothetical protein
MGNVPHDKKTPQKLNAHAKRRAEERYGLNLNKEARHEIVSMIQSNQAEFIGKQSNNRSLWRVQYHDQSLNVVYDKARSTMCTVLPREAHEFQKGGWNEPETKASSSASRAEITAELSEIWKDVE